MGFKSFLKRHIMRTDVKLIGQDYLSSFNKYSFTDCKCQTIEQFEASIIRLYHTIEKGLSYEDYRAGFGKDNIEKLIVTLEQYAANGYDCTLFAYETALSCLWAYIQKNKEYGYEDLNLEERIKNLPGRENAMGGTIRVSAPIHPEALTYRQLITERHSIRHFSSKPVEIQLILEAIKLAQFTPSACNRQGWRTRIVTDKEKIGTVLANQNGNRGFGMELDKLLVVTADLRTQQKNREVFQAFIDGGMYAENVLNSLYSLGIGSVPLSAALTSKQESNIRKAININKAEIIILFIGVGNYPEGEFLTTRSERKPADIEII